MPYKNSRPFPQRINPAWRVWAAFAVFAGWSLWRWDQQVNDWQAAVQALQLPAGVKLSPPYDPFLILVALAAIVALWLRVLTLEHRQRS